MLNLIKTQWIANFTPMRHHFTVSRSAKIWKSNNCKHARYISIHFTIPWTAYTHYICSLTCTCFITKIFFKRHLVLAIKIMVLDPAESSFSEIMGLKTRLQWAEKDLWGKDLKTTTDNYFKLTFEVGQTGLQL